MGFNLDDYESVADRIDRFWKDNPNGRITTDLVHHDDKRFIVKVSVWKESARVIDVADFIAEGGKWIQVLLEADATGYAEEIVGSTNVNKTSALENCETSAIGRALANLGYASKGQRASREEMAKAQPEPRPRSGGRKVTPTPEPQENHKTAPVTDASQVQVTLGPDVAVEVKRMKNWAFQQLGKDADKTKAIWEQVLSTYNVTDGLPHADSLQFVESDLSIAVGEALTEELVNP